MNVLKTKELPLAKGCPRCGSARIYSTDEEFICLACSYIVVRPEVQAFSKTMKRAVRKRKQKKKRR